MSTREFLVIENKNLVKKTGPVPVLGDHDVLVEVKAVAINPTDWKHVLDGYGEGAIGGNDFSGIIVKVGKSVSSVKVGDKVHGGVSGGDVFNKENGAFTNLLKTSEGLIHRFDNLEPAVASVLPASKASTTFEGAASVPLCLWTIGEALVHYSNTPLIKDSKKGSGFALVYGAGTSLGWYAIQILHYLGYEVIAVGSKRSAETLKKIGADFVVDYHDSDWEKQVHKIGGDDIVYLYDTYGEGTSEKVASLASKTRAATLHSALPPEFPSGAPKGLKTDFPFYYFLFTDKKKRGPTVLEAPEGFGLPKNGPRVVEEVSRLLDEGVIDEQPVKIVGEGLDAIAKALDIVHEGTAGPNTKVVVRL